MEKARSLITIITTFVVFAVILVIASSARPAETALLVSALTGHQTNVSSLPSQGLPQTGSALLPWTSNPTTWLLIGVGVVLILGFVITARLQKDSSN
jgi:hypothetical protein